MHEQAIDLDQIISRLKRVEAENRKPKRLGLSVLVLVGAFLLMGQAQGTKTVEATQFNVKDSSGRIRAALGTIEGFTQLTLYGPEGVQNTNLSASMVLVGNGPQGPYVTFTDAKGKTRLELNMDRGDSPGFWLFNGAAEEVASLTASGNYGRLSIGRVGGPEQFQVSVGPDYGSGVVLSDKAGFKTTIGTADLQTPRTGGTHRTSAASVILFGKDKTVLWSAP
jgi:hypothetical protein